MQTSASWLYLLLEWLSWVLFFFAWAILSRVAFRRLRRIYPGQLVKERRAYYLSMALGFLVYLKILLFLVDPFISALVAAAILSPDHGPSLFWIMAILFYFLIPFVSASVFFRIYREKQV
ncbi:MAG: hypothetical protein JNL88_07980 [Bacteroidia bacterium]|nr:hypothetical protein [Bacteroidia bacterium]